MSRQLFTDGILMGSTASMVIFLLLSISMVFSLLLSSVFKRRNTRIWLLLAEAFAVGNIVGTVGTQNLVYVYPSASNQYAAGLAFSGGVAANSILHVYLHDLIRLLRPLVTRNSNADRDDIRVTENLFDQNVWSTLADAPHSHLASSRYQDVELPHIKSAKQQQAADKDQGTSTDDERAVSFLRRQDVTNFLQESLVNAPSQAHNSSANPLIGFPHGKHDEASESRCRVYDLVYESSDFHHEHIDDYDASRSDISYNAESENLLASHESEQGSKDVAHFLENQLKFQRQASGFKGTMKYSEKAGESSCPSQVEMREINPYYTSAGEASSLPYNSVHHGTAESHGESPSNAISTHSKSARSGHLTESGRHTSGILPVQEHFLNPYEIGVDGEMIESDTSSIYYADDEGSEASIPIVVRDNIAVDDIVGGNIFGSNLVHSLVEGLIIGSSFTRGFVSGAQICTSLFLCSVPTMIGLLASLMRAGYAPSIALKRQILSNIPIIAGGIFGSSIASFSDTASLYAGAFNSGQLVFLALAELFHSLRIQHQPHPLKNYLVMLFLAGLGLPIAVNFLPLERH